MSLSALPEWKQLLLERKRREEEERERREREEEERLASMPAWKRGIIQRRRAKQDEEREREKERDGGQHTPDILGITEDIVPEQVDSKFTLHLQTDHKMQKQISKEIISPIQQSPFIRSENSFKRDNRGKEVIRDGENEYKMATNNRGREKNKETEKEIWRGHDREMWVEKMGSKSEGRERDRSTGRESWEADSSASLFSPVVGLRTIQANNIIIIEKYKNSKEKLDKGEKEVEEEQKRMRMDLREFLAGGGSVTEIRASEVLIIKPPMTDGRRETKTAGITERGSERLEKEGIWSSMRMTSRTVMQKAERVLNHKERGTPECSGRVSQLLSKFGEHPKPPMRSKSIEGFNQPGKNRARYSTGDLFVQEDQSMEETDTSPTFRGAPKRSFSFSDRVVCQQEARDCEEKTDFKVVERVKTRVTDQSGSEPKVSGRWSQPKPDEVMHENRLKERRVENKRNDSVRGETEEWTSSLDGEGFTVASVKIPEGLAFARRVPIKHDGRESSSEREIKKVREENEREIMIDKEIHRDKGRVERETAVRQRPIELEPKDKTESERRWNQDELSIAVSKQPHGIYIPPSDDSTIDFPEEMQCQCVDTTSAYSSCPTTAYAGQVVLTQHTEDLVCKIAKVQSDRELKRAGYMFSHGDMETRISGEMGNQDQKEHQQYQSFPKQATEEIHFTSEPPQQTFTLGQNKLCTQERVTIPRTIFYGVDISAERRRVSLPSGDKQDGGQVERRGSWKSGQSLTRVESLRESIRQQEKERRDDDKEEGSREAGGTVREQEETTLQTLRLFDVTQDVSMAKSSPQLPVPVSLSLLQSVSTGREVGEISRDVSERDICPREAERDVEERGTCIVWRTQDVDEREEEREEELLEKEYLPPSLSPSPPLSDSLDAMSRIYNLKTVGSRTTVCISERKADMPPHSGPQGKYNLIRQAPSPDILPETAKLWNHGRDGDKTETIESTGAQMVQRQVERLQLREQEAGCGSHNDKKAQPTMESCPLVEPEIRVAEGQKKPDILRETQKSQTPTSPRFPQAQQKAQRQPPKPQQVRSFTINARNTESTENSQKPPEQNSPSSSSPCTASPSSSPSPPLFSIRSASGGPGKRGTTITITPRRPAGAASSGGLPTVTPAVPKAAPQGHITTPAPSSTKEAGKKRYPTAEEIEVIGGYQNLERSCLVKSKGTLKAVKVCFDDAQLERVCEYPSEDCALASLPSSPHPGPEDGGRDEQEAEGQEEDEEEESAPFVSHSGMNESAGRIRFLKVDESCKRLSK
ncbi:trichohyalin-like isoform X2 [Sinocyclocheilus grahami]|uniref:trichohyalin-like isoform X2 n=1 Tax=Sinocyclocheilus grahami TaxID=75366 RepID=UPI0007ACC05B|nr:PREDICTED: trichohyalin-like isoform X2 [Sinocyclocheilus grahami]